ncbi:Protein of unknown function [Sphingomonas guangdongensis]|uniref:Glycosidase n=1 Tax=Sphingomonas guangdongensis TaxID=1141890 RepID=A0A285QYX2_9SPHN|nr:DUF2840 domain-containing protein [Sphingomonas guangdongensis]SOB87150.1 Protein of unknown function [Sphingomonas guangdongensis]
MTSATATTLAADSPLLTQVELIWVEQKTEHWIRFGRELREQILDRRRRRLFFSPNAIFALVRWASNDHGTVASRIDILRAPTADEGFQTVPTVSPGAEILLRAAGWPKVTRVLEHLDEIEARDIDLCAIAPDHWRHVHNRLTVGEPPRRYTLARHRAFQKMQEIGA